MNLFLAAGAAAFVALTGLSACHHDKPAPTAAVVAPPIQIKLDGQVQKLLDARSARVAKSQADTDEASDALHAAPSAADPLPDDLLNLWRTDVQRVRSDGDFGSATPGAGSGELAQAVPAAGPDGR